MTLEGILPIWKPKGFTSHDVVAKVRRIVRIKRIGHTGTLDPQVTGVLPLCIGRATRLVEYVQEMPKSYEAVLLLGLSTDTQDLSGQVLQRLERPGDLLTPQQVTEAIAKFVGTIEQVPPMYSAVKVEGRRLYELARQGVEVERKARTVTIYSIEVLNTDWSGELPEVRFRVSCSKGTYIRTLCADIGEALGIPAVMGELVRTSTGNIGPEQCLTLEQVEELHEHGSLSDKLIPMEHVLGFLPSVRLDEHLTRRALQGQKIRLEPQQWPHANSSQADLGKHIAGFSDDGRLIGIFEWDPQHGLLLPNKIFS
ncbi:MULTISPECIES: tRNA pseudouridine(55) synthase TruB [unclassified Paenibacillus]|uniref:tRNA pseudouridine(55) synthase TruB n=1 Tax=unclassified Paenibacillus TaxID=185978 RepID=UPI001AE56B75|nr:MULTISPECIES: tRNA pseudouridine(55) synthase TruB [unclassified Paenibacillus]MBP1155960.1 tRNA pseudouridine55 synthase [Paenibacillus sp. PvP091]MBP1168654.1 tRNA pseudouridine55 synthase [Paenibacillus sp. PvR098]MBP2439682.1 tRNA pseudouridine55 synthase [Paenibacillus sp. PvP052]